MSNPLITPEVARQFAVEGAHLRREYHKRVRAMWALDTPQPPRNNAQTMPSKITAIKQPHQCSYLCPPHLDRCTRQTNEHGGWHEGDCACEKCPKGAPPQ